MHDFIRRSAGVFLLLAVAAGACSTASNEPGPVASPIGSTFLLTDVRLLSMATGELTPGSMILVRDGVIAWVGADGEEPPDAGDVPRVAGEGDIVMPGLIDMHVHLSDRDELDLYLLNGVTSVANLSGRPMHLEMRQEVREGTRRGPWIYTAGRTIDGDPPRNPRFQPLGDPERAEEVVAEQAEAGYDFIKVYDLIETEPYEALVAAAEARGLAVVGHIPKKIGLEGILGGHDLIAHAEEFYYTFFDYRDDRDRLAEAAEVTAAAGVAVCPNTAFIHAIIQQAEDIDSVLAWPEFRYLPVAAQIAWLPENNRYTNRTPEWLARNKVMYPFLVELTRALHDAGVPVVVGSDASVPGGVPGFALHKEIAEIEKAGLSRLDALRAATLTTARWIEEHLGDREVPGEVEAGRRADFLVLPGDPLQDLTALAAPRAVVASGRWHERSDLAADVERRAEAYAAELVPYHGFKELIEAGDPEAAKVLLAEASSEALGEAALNRLGYSYLYRREDAGKAVQVFKLNVERHPESWNVWDSLGEGQKAAGDVAAAIRSYERSLELNPDNTGGREQLEELRRATH